MTNFTIYDPDCGEKTDDAFSSEANQVPAMGQMADKIWTLLTQKGKMSISGIAREVGAPRDYIMEGIGWLGSEGRITVVEESRTRLVMPYPE